MSVSFGSFEGSAEVVYLKPEDSFSFCSDAFCLHCKSWHAGTILGSGVGDVGSVVNCLATHAVMRFFYPDANNANNFNRRFRLSFQLVM